MSSMKRKHIVAFILILIIDQLTKLAISSNMQLFDSIDIISGFFSITYVQNTGAAWSIMEGGSMAVFYVITFVALVIMISYYRSSECDALGKWGIVMMMGGTIGNFIDRLRLQYVVDFLSFDIFGYDFPIFNVADIFLCLGVGILILSFILEGVKKNEA